jgi:hypothetical protein
MSLSVKFQERTACSMVIKVFGKRGERGPFGCAIGALGRGHEDVKPLGKRETGTFRVGDGGPWSWAPLIALPSASLLHLQRRTNCPGATR